MTTTKTATAATAAAPATTQVYRVYIKATPEAIWQAITDPEWTNRYGYTGYTTYDLRPGGAFAVTPNDQFRAEVEASGYPCPDVLVDGEVVEADPPRRLVTTWRMLMDPELAAEGFTRLTYEIEPIDGGACSLTLVHELEGAPKLAALVSGQNQDAGQGGGGGHAWVLSDLKSLLETGSTLAGGG
jgi:uncharacterized protein YndB with AHSA1/START domain